MTNVRDFIALLRAILWRTWIEQRGAIVAFPLLMAVLFAVVLLVTRFAPGWLTGPTLQALQATAGDAAASPAALSRAFIDHQAPYLLALFAGMSAASAAVRLIGAESERGSLEILLATRHGIRAIGAAMLLAAWVIAGLGWAILAGLSSAATALFCAWLQVDAPSSPGLVGAAIAMQLVLTLLAAELALIVALLLPGLARARPGITGDPTTLLAALPALLAFTAANLWPTVSMLRLSLSALALGVLLLLAGAVSLGHWFRPEKFLES